MLDSVSNLDKHTSTLCRGWGGRGEWKDHMLAKVQSVPGLLTMILWMDFNVKIGPYSDEVTTMMGFLFN